MVHPVHIERFGFYLFAAFHLGIACPASIASERDTTITSTAGTGSGSGLVDYFAENGFGKPVSTMQHPAGEYFNGVTYVAYQGPHEDPFVCAYHHNTGEWVGPVRAGVSALGRSPAPTDAGRIDNHGRPALFVDNEGYIHLVFGGHGGHRIYGSNPLGYNGSGKQSHVVTKAPGDISAWEELDNIPPFGTYSQFVKMGNGSLYLFYRHGSHRSDWVYQKSTNNGRSFTAPVSILKHKQRDDDPTVHDSWYAWFEEGPDNTVVCSFNYHPCATRPDHTSLRINSYFIKMDGADDSWENISGESLSVPLTKEMADKRARIFDSQGEKTRLGTIRVDREGDPHLYFRYFSATSSSVYYYRWKGNTWHSQNRTDPVYRFSDGDIDPVDSKSSSMLLVQRAGDLEEVSWWSTVDGGASWRQGTTLMSSSSANLGMSALIRNAHPDARVVVAEISRDPADMNAKLYLLGDSGPVRRSASEFDEKTDATR
jgi:hypothetical protein